MNIVPHLAAGVFALGLALGDLSVVAFEKFEEYRIAGSEIRSVDLAAPAMPEDPHVLTIATVNEDVIELEADNEARLLEDCRDVVERVIGNATAYVQIVLLANAQTMNGSLLVQCTDLHSLIRAD